MKKSKSGIGGDWPWFRLGLEPIATFIAIRPMVGMHVNIISAFLQVPPFMILLHLYNNMRPRPIPTLLEFSTNKILTALLVKERAKCRKRNNSEAHHRLDKDCPIEELTARKMLSRMMPPRYTWVRPKKREVLHNEATDKSKNAEKALWLTIQRDRKLQTNGIASPSYLKELDAYIEKIRQRLMTGDITFASPQLMPLL